MTDSLGPSDNKRPPAARGGMSHMALDALKHRMAVAVVSRFSAQDIRAQILANFNRWRQQGTWGAPYIEWLAIAESNDDGDLYTAMLGGDDDAVRLRQSMPFVGLLTSDELRNIHDQMVV